MKKEARLTRTRTRSFFHAPAELAAARETIERLISRYDGERDARHVLEAWLVLRKGGLQPTDTMLEYLDQIAHQVLKRATAGAVLDDSPVGELIAAWHAIFNDRPITARAAIGQAFNLSTPEAKRLDLALRKVMQGWGRALAPRQLAAWLRAHERRSIDGFAFVRAAERDHVLQWKVMPM